MAKKYFNTALSGKMLPDNLATIPNTISEADAAAYLKNEEVVNVANPTHANTLDAVSKRLGVDVRGAKGGFITMGQDDVCLVVEVTGLPRETREYTDEEIAKAKFAFRIFQVN